MTKKTYIGTVGIIREARRNINNDKYDKRDTVDSIRTALADMFETDNPKFDRAKFIQACSNY